MKSGVSGRRVISNFQLLPTPTFHCPFDSASRASLKRSAQRLSVDSLIFPSGVFMPIPSVLMSNRTDSRSEITLRNLVSDRAFQLSGTDLYLFRSGAVILLSEVTGSEVFKRRSPF